MHIILTDENANHLKSKYTLLELDRVKLTPDQDPVTAYCVLEEIPFEELPKIEEFKNLHIKLMENYRKRNWNFCEQAIEHLHGRWGGQCNSFYDEISQRIAKYKEQEPGKDWDPAIKKY